MHVSSVENEGYFRRISRVCVIVNPQPGAGLPPPLTDGLGVRAPASGVGGVGVGGAGGEWVGSGWKSPGLQRPVCLCSFIFVFLKSLGCFKV